LEGKKEVITMSKKHTIIELKKAGKSNREINKDTGIARRIIAKYWYEHLNEQAILANTTDELEIRQLQAKITSEPKYDSSARRRSKFTEAVKKRLYAILEDEERKKLVLGPNNKQFLTKIQIHEVLSKEGYNVSYTVVRCEINTWRSKHGECFVRQQYVYGDRLEYDFGEYKAIILDEGPHAQKFYLAVMVSPAGKHRWAYVYDNCKKEVFLDSQVRFFHQFGGIWREMVYDNMKNVVTKFIGLNEKELNPDLINLSLYYGFKINVTNCYSGNEKGSVEGGVKFIRNKVFAKTYTFASRKMMEEHLESELMKLNETSLIDEEIKHLLPIKPKYELAGISENNVNSYGCIQIDKNFYSVPDYLIDKTVVVKNYLKEIDIYINNEFVCSHQKIDGSSQFKIELKHHLSTFMTKPGALKNSIALKSFPRLKSIYDEYYSMDNETTKYFLGIIKDNIDKNMSELIEIFEERITWLPAIMRATEYKIKEEEKLKAITRKQTSMYNQMSLGRSS